jgi:hypothetical protein
MALILNGNEFRELQGNDSRRGIPLWMHECAVIRWPAYAERRFRILLLGLAGAYFFVLFTFVPFFIISGISDPTDQRRTQLYFRSLLLFAVRAVCGPRLEVVVTQFFPFIVSFQLEFGEKPFELRFIQIGGLIVLSGGIRVGQLILIGSYIVDQLTVRLEIYFRHFDLLR